MITQWFNLKFKPVIELDELNQLLYVGYIHEVLVLTFLHPMKFDAVLTFERILTLLCNY